MREYKNIQEEIVIDIDDVKENVGEYHLEVMENLEDNIIKLYTKIKQLEAEKQQYIKLLTMTLDCEDNHCDHCKEDIQKALEVKDG